MSFRITRYIGSHPMEHYITSIHALGTADGYNTESPERLHLEFAKRVYAATNKCDYKKQMVWWLHCQEGVVEQQAYLHWVRQKGLYTKPSCSKSSLSPDDEDKAEDSEDKAEVHAPLVVSLPQARLSALPAYRLAKKPPLSNTPGNILMELLGAQSLVPHLKEFLLPRHRNGTLQLHSTFSEFSCLNVWITACFIIDPIGELIASFKDRARCTPGR